ncbi:hypothetical protein BC629DRAFT_1473146 [Irpex lacteus]|nr:hypothetical protein BC629DRAFT_1473146 [Irpex lacteus]
MEVATVLMASFPFFQLLSLLTDDVDLDPIDFTDAGLDRDVVESMANDSGGLEGMADEFGLLMVGAVSMRDSKSAL